MSIIREYSPQNGIDSLIFSLNSFSPNTPRGWRIHFSFVMNVRSDWLHTLNEIRTFFSENPDAEF